MNYPDYLANPDAVYNDDGIWYTKPDNKISYPEGGNSECFQLEDRSFWFRHRNNCILAAIDQFSPTERFFDIGGGNGFVALALQNSGKDVVLIEPGKNGCTNARRRNIQQIVCGRFEDIQLKESSVGACGFFDVIEHVEKDIDLLKNLHAFVNPSGKVYITVPAYSFLWSQEDADAGHYRRYTIATISAVLKEAGFAIIYSSYLFSFLPLPIYFSRTLPHILKLKNKKPDHQKDHSNDHGSGIIEKLMDWELKQIKRKKRIPFGSSCFVVAEKR